MRKAFGWLVGMALVAPLAGLGAPAQGQGFGAFVCRWTPVPGFQEWCLGFFGGWFAGTAYAMAPFEMELTANVPATTCPLTSTATGVIKIDGTVVANVDLTRVGTEVVMSLSAAHTGVGVAEYLPLVPPPCPNLGVAELVGELQAV